MPKIIKDKAIVNDDWTLLKLAEGESAEAVNVPSGKQIVPLKVWLAQITKLKNRSDIGVWIASDERAEVLGDAVTTLPLIAIDFPSFSDGRGYCVLSVMCCAINCFICSAWALMPSPHAPIEA